MIRKGNEKMPTRRQKVIHNPIPTSLFCSKLLLFYIRRENTYIVQKAQLNAHIKWVKILKEKRCRYGVMKNFLSWCRHLLFSFLFHDLTSLHPLHLIFLLVPLIFHFRAKPLQEVALRCAPNTLTSLHPPSFEMFIPLV